MFIKIALFIFITISLYAQEKSWYQKINPSIELGMHVSVFGGSIDNIHSKTDVYDDLAYKDSSSSYLALGLRTDYTYFPNFKVNYFLETQNTSVEHNSTIYIADGIFDSNATISSAINYSVVNFTIYHDFKQKGTYLKFLRWRFYPGDIEYYLGINLKIIQWRIDLEHSIQKTKHWINVEKNIPLPYAGFQYFYKNFRAFANISAISFNEAKSLNFEYGLAYQLYKDLYINGSYLYENFQVTESAGNHIDTIKFKTFGNKFSVKYIF